jgi:hypothetical protein
MYTTALMPLVMQDGLPTAKDAPSPYDELLFTNASFSGAAGANVYFLCALVAIVAACEIAAGQLWRDNTGAAAAWHDTNLSLLLVSGVSALLAAMYVWVRRTSGNAPAPPLNTWLAVIALGGAIAAGLAHNTQTQSKQDAGAWGAVPRGATPQLVCAGVLAAIALLGAVVQYADGTLRVDRLGAAAGFSAAAFAAALLSFYAIVLFYSTGADAFPKNASIAGGSAAAGGAAILILVAFGASALAARVSSAVADYRGVPVASSRESARFAQQTRSVVSVATLAAVLVPLLVVLSSAGARAAQVSTGGLVAAAAAYAAWLPVATAFAVAAIRLRSLTPGVYQAVSSLMIAAAIVCAAQLIPWTPTAVWAVAVLPALALLFAATAGQDGGSRKLTVALTLTGGFAAAQLLGSKWLALAPAAAVLLFLQLTGRPLIPAVIFVGAVLASIADSGAGPGIGDATAAELTARALSNDDGRAALAGQTAAALVASLLVISELVAIAKVTLDAALGGLAGIQGANASPLARTLGLILVIVFASFATRGVAGALSDVLVFMTPATASARQSGPASSNDLSSSEAPANRTPSVTSMFATLSPGTPPWIAALIAGLVGAVLLALLIGLYKAKTRAAARKSPAKQNSEIDDSTKIDELTEQFKNLNLKGNQNANHFPTNKSKRNKSPNSFQNLHMNTPSDPKSVAENSGVSEQKKKHNRTGNGQVHAIASQLKNFDFKGMQQAAKERLKKIKNPLKGRPNLGNVSDVYDYERRLSQGYPAPTLRKKNDLFSQMALKK